MLTFPFDTVEGLISTEDKLDLRTMSMCCSNLPGDYVEIGSLHGLSTLCILSGMPKDKMLWSYDVNHPSNKAMQNIEAAGYGECVGFVFGDFMDKLSPASTQPVAFAFVDHDHRLETTVSAYKHLWPRLVPYGILAFHDYQHIDYPEPTPFFDALPHQRFIARPGLIAFVKW